MIQTNEKDKCEDKDGDKDDDKGIGKGIDKVGRGKMQPRNTEMTMISP